MKIAFVFPFNKLGGAFRSSYELCNELIKLGHEVTVIFPLLEPAKAKTFEKQPIKYSARSIVRAIVRRSKIDWFDCKFKLHTVLSLNTHNFDPYDQIILNHWQTIYEFLHHNKKYLPKCTAFIRDIEQWAPFYPLQTEMFSAEIKFVAVSDWVAKHIEYFSNQTVPVIPNAINTTQFYNRRDQHSLNKKQAEQLKIGAILNDHPMKGMDILEKILKNLSETPCWMDYQIHLVGNSKQLQIPSRLSVTKHGLLTTKKMSSFYNNVDCFIFSSRQEGWGNPPIEAYFSGCQVLSTPTGSIESIWPELTQLILN